MMQHVSAQTLGNALGISRQAVSELAERGIIERAADGKFDRDECTRAYCSHLRKSASGRAASEANAAAKRASLEAGAKLKAQQEQLTALRLKKESGEMVSLACFDTAVIGAYRFFAMTFRALLPRLNAGLHLPPDQARKCEEILRRAMADVRKTEPKDILINTEAYECALAMKGISPSDFYLERLRDITAAEDTSTS